MRSLALLFAVMTATAAPLPGQLPEAGGEPIPAEERVAAYDAATRRLLRMGVLRVAPRPGYCVVLSPRDAEVEGVIRGILGDEPPEPTDVDPIPLDVTDCPRNVGLRRYVLDEPRRADDGTVTVTVSGDDLLEWPPSLDGLYWGRWSARCTVTDAGSDGTSCDVRPVSTGERAVDERSLDRRGRFFGTNEVHPAGGRPARLVARNTGSARADTMDFGVDSVAYVYDLPVLSPGHDRCTASSLLSAYSAWPPAGHRLVRIELATEIEFAPQAARLMDVVQDRAEADDGPVIAVQCGEPRSQPFAITSLEEVGLQLDGPVRHCPDDRCSHEVIVPVHDPLPLAARFRLSDFDLGDEGEGDTVHLQFETNGWGTGLVPFLVILGDHPWAEAFRPTWHSRHHRVPLNRGARFEGDPEVLLFLVRR